jgi:hypothetical protein
MGFAMRLRINSQESLSSAIRELTAAYKDHKYLVVSYRIGRDRTLDQNALWFEMYKRIASMTAIGTEEDARRYCKLHLGVPIMRAADEGFRDGWDKLMRPLPYEAKLELMGACALYGADGFPVTRLFDRKAGIAYTEAIVAEFAGRGVVFDDLLSEG